MFVPIALQLNFVFGLKNRNLAVKKLIFKHALHLLEKTYSELIIDFCIFKCFCVILVNRYLLILLYHEYTKLPNWSV